MFKLSQIDKRQYARVKKALEKGLKVFALPQGGNLGCDIRIFCPITERGELYSFIDGPFKTAYWHPVVIENTELGKIGKYPVISSVRCT